MSRRQILCLSGGGFAGLFAAKFLALLEAQCPDSTNLGTHFDAFAGTSVGGLIALGLASGSPATEILAILERYGPAVFPRKRGGFGRMIWHPKHRIAPLRQHVTTLLGDRTLHDLTKPVLIPSVSLSSGQPKLFRAIPGRVHSDSQTSLVDVALATSAAPLYFPPHSIQHDLYADGSVIANVPDPLAILDATQRLGWHRDDLSILSIGTTYVPPGVLTHSTAQWGLVKWMLHKRKLFAITMIAQMRLSLEIARQLVPPERLIRIDPALSPEQAKAIGLDLAHSKASETLQAIAGREVNRLPPAQLKQLLHHVARDY